MSNYLFSFLFGIGAGFVINFPPRKIQAILLGAGVVFVIAVFALLLDSGYSNWSWDWIDSIFNLSGYAVGYAISYGAKAILNVRWKLK